MAAVDVHTLTLLFGMMIVTAHLRLSGLLQPGHRVDSPAGPHTTERARRGGMGLQDPLGVLPPPWPACGQWSRPGPPRVPRSRELGSDPPQGGPLIQVPLVLLVLLVLLEGAP